jgi:2-phosphosulfolactate phosphatase
LLKQKRIFMSDGNQKTLEVCFSPALFKTYDAKGKIVVLVDILRATSTICTAFQYGVKEIIPVASVKEARRYKSLGYIVAGERNGKVLPFADFGNSPFNFMNDSVAGQSIVYSTTNGTKAIQIVKGCSEMVFGSYLNHYELAVHLIDSNRDVLVLCSGWKNKFSLEDTVFAGALCKTLLESGQFITICDSVLASVDLWDIAEKDLLGYIQKAAHRHRLRKLGLDDVLEYCHTYDATSVVPILKGNSIVAI